MDIFSLSAHLGLDKSGYDSGIQEAKSDFTGLASHLQNVAKTIGKMWLFKEAVQGIKNLTSAVVNAYAEYEQLAGGVETLFGNAADAVKAYADAAYQTAGMSANEYMSTVTSFAAALVQGAANSTSQSTAITKEAADAQYQAVKDSYDRQYEAAQDAYNRQYSAMQTSLNKQYKALQKSLKKQYEAASRNAEDEIEAYSESLDKRLEKLQASQDKEYRRLQKATDKKLALIEKEYQATIKRIDRERAARIGAIDAELAALDKEQAEKDKANRDAERETTKQRLQEAVQWARTVGERVNAQNKLNDYLEQIRIEDEKDARQARIDELKDQKTQIQDEAKAEEDAAKDKRDKNSKAVKTEGDAQLAALKKSQQKQLAAMQKSNAEALKQFRRAKQDELQALQESQNEQLEAVSESNAAQLANLKRSQQARLKAMKRGQNAQLKALKASLKQQQKVVNEGVKVTAEAQAAAAEVANMAIQDMADNANKMGTPLQSIQNAYQGFAKQNYTMLDNLKLGYGGTKTEMERLLKDAEAIEAQQGRTTKFSINNLSDVYKAIHVVQEELKITGTTAAEASGTISGSWAATKAAWQNLIVAMGRGEDIETATNNLIDSFGNVVKNVIPVLGRLFPAVGTAIWTAIKTGINATRDWLYSTLFGENWTPEASWDGVGAKIWEAIQNGVNAVNGWLLSLVLGDDYTPESGWGDVGDKIWGAIKAGFAITKGWLLSYLLGDEYTPEPGWETAGAKIWAEIKSGFDAAGDWIKQLVLGDEYTPDASWSQVGVDIWNKIVEGLAGAVDWLKGLFDDWTKKLSDGSIDFESIGSTIWTAISGAFAGAVQWFKYLFGGKTDGDTESVKGVIASVDWAGLGTSMLYLIGSAFSAVGETFKGFFVEAWNSINKLNWSGLGKNMWTAIKNAFKGVTAWFKETFKKPINAVIDFLNDMIGKVEDAVNTIVDGINSHLHITIPNVSWSWDFYHGNGGFSTDYANPFMDWNPQIGRVSLSRIQKLAEGGVVRNGGHAIVGEGGYPEYLRVVNGQAIVTPMRNAAPAGTNVTINVYQQPGEDSQALANRIQRVFVRNEMQRRAARGR